MPESSQEHEREEPRNRSTVAEAVEEVKRKHDDTTSSIRAALDMEGIDPETAYEIIQQAIQMLPLDAPPSVRQTAAQRALDAYRTQSAPSGPPKPLTAAEQTAILEQPPQERREHFLRTLQQHPAGGPHPFRVAKSQREAHSNQPKIPPLPKS